jgi:hypothetical protein
LLSAAVGGLWWRQAQTIPDTTTSKPADNQTVSPAGNGEELYRCWTFEDGPPDGFQTASGKWEWRRNPRTNRGEMYAFGDERTAVIPPVKMPSRPFEVRLTVEPLLLTDTNHLIKNAKQSVNRRKDEFRWPTANTAYWASPEEKFSFNVWASSINKRSDEPTTMRIVFVKRHVFQYPQDGSINRVTEYERPYPDDKFFIFIKNSVISKIEVRMLREDEIAEELREPQKVVERFNLQPWGREGPQNKIEMSR